jgi:tetratricopeptide (TPR) repeat protein
MKKIVLFSFIALVLFSCNERKNDPSKNQVLPQEEQKLKDSINAYPDSILLKENLIQYYRENGNFGKAISETEKFIAKDSMNDRFWDILATLHFENGDTLKSIKSFEKAINIKAEPEYIISLASLYAETKNPAALILADALLQSQKAHAREQALFIKGLYYSYTNEKVKAISFFDECIDLNYTNMLAYREKAICLYDMEKYNDALKVLERAVTLQNSYAEGYYWMGKCYEKNGVKAAAIESYKAALELDKDFPEAVDALAKLGVK